MDREDEGGRHPDAHGGLPLCISHYAEIAGLALKDEGAVLSLARGERRGGRQKERHRLILLDSPGKQLSSEELAQFLEREQIKALPLLFAVGGADGFSDQARRQATFALSLGRMTLPHELARVVLLRAALSRLHHPEKSPLSPGTLTIR